MQLPQDVNTFCCSELRYPVLPHHPLLPHVPLWLLSCCICTCIKNGGYRNYYFLEWNRSAGLKYPPFAEHTGSLPWRLLWQKGEMETAGFSVMLVTLYQTTRRHAVEDSTARVYGLQTRTSRCATGPNPEGN